MDLGPRNCYKSLKTKGARVVFLNPRNGSKSLKTKGKAVCFASIATQMRNPRTDEQITPNVRNARTDKQIVISTVFHNVLPSVQKLPKMTPTQCIFNYFYLYHHLGS